MSTRRELLSKEIELLLRDMVDEFVDWRSHCGRSGWYEMPKDEVRKFFEQFILDAVRKTANTYAKKLKINNQ